MTTTRMRVRARRNRKGCLLEWHPADRDDAERLLEDHRAVVVALYSVVDRRLLEDSQVVLELDVQESGRVDDLEVATDVRRDLPLDDLEEARETIEASAGGERVHA